MNIKDIATKFKEFRGKKIKANLGTLIPVGLVIVLALLIYFYKGLFIAATVNGQPISRLSLIRELEKQDGKSVLDSLVTRSLILQEAKKQKIVVSDGEVNQSVTQLEENLKKQGQNLDQLLAAQGMTRNDLKDQIRIQKIVEAIVGKDIKITDKEVSDYLEQNKSSLPADIKPEEATASARGQLRQQKISEKIQSWIQGLKDRAKINYFVKF